MKKNITINLFGALYAIDEDAYELLKQYQDNMRRYFCHKEGGEEIADDIEHRVAELLAELKASGVEAITIEHIEEIIHRIGNPEEVDEDEGCEAESPKSEKPKSEAFFKFGKRLYRDPDDMVLGGVMSGIARYTGNSDPIWWRLLLVLLCIFSNGFFAVAYLVLWLILPLAITPEDRLRMQGIPVNTETLNEEMMRGVNKTRESIASPENRRRATGCFSTALRLIIGFICVILLAFLALFFIGLIVAFIFLLWGFSAEGSMVANHLIGNEAAPLWFGLPGFTWQVGTIIVAGIGAVALPAYVLIRRLTNPTRTASSTAKRSTLVIVWMLLVALTLGLSINLAVRYNILEDNAYLDKHTRGSVILTRDSWTLIDSGKWEIKQLRGCGRHIASWQPNIITGNRHQYFELNRDHLSGESMEIDICRTVEAEPGTYHLEGLGLADALGAKVYAMRNDTTVILGDVPVTVLRGNGNLKDIPWSKARTVGLFAAVKDSLAWDSISHSGRAQNYIESKTFHHPGGKLTYGFMLLSGYNLVPWMGNRLAVIELSPVRIEESK